VAIAAATPLRDEDNWSKFAFVVMAEKDGDVAYVGSDWNEGLLPWEFGLPLNLREASPMLRGTVFSDRGVYRPGEEVHLKAILRHNASDGIRLLSEGTPVFATLRDIQDRVVDQRTVKVNAWSSAEWTVTLPAAGSLGQYQLQVMLESDRPKPRGPAQLRPWETPGPEADRYVPYTKVVNGSFLVAAYRRPDFRVDVTLTGTPLIAGADLSGSVTARYLFGATMGARPLRWTFTKQPVGDAPPAVREAFSPDRWLFVGWSDREPAESGEVGRDQVQLTASGERQLTLPTKRDAGVPYAYTLEGDVEDVSRQHIANRATITVHPAPWYIGVRQPPYFVEQKSGVKTEIVAVTPAGAVVAGVPVTVTLTQVQWTSVRRAEGNGFYTWDTERKEVPAGSWAVTTADALTDVSGHTARVQLATGGIVVVKIVRTIDEVILVSLPEGINADSFDVSDARPTGDDRVVVHDEDAPFAVPIGELANADVEEATPLLDEDGRLLGLATGEPDAHWMVPVETVPAPPPTTTTTSTTTTSKTVPSTTTVTSTTQPGSSTTVSPATSEPSTTPPTVPATTATVPPTTAASTTTPPTSSPPVTTPSGGPGATGGTG